MAASPGDLLVVLPPGAAAALGKLEILYPGVSKGELLLQSLEASVAAGSHPVSSAYHHADVSRRFVVRTVPFGFTCAHQRQTRCTVHRKLSEQRLVSSYPKLRTLRLLQSFIMS
eukprot:scaffold24228_cov37-Prasinocladus_malaysianus.AAC.1